MTVILPPGQGPKRPRKSKRMRPVRPTRAARKQYLDALTEMVQLLRAATGNLSDLIRSGADRVAVAAALLQASQETQARIDSLAPGTARSVVTQVDREQKAATEKAIGQAMSVDFARIIDSPNVAADLQLALTQNTALIKSIGSEHWGLVSQAVLDNYRGVPLPEDVSLTKRLQQLGGITERRAAFIARDQTAKLTGSLNATRQQDNGITEYIWRTAGDQRVVGNPGGLYPKGSRGHEDHYARDGKRFKWSEPPADGHPGQAFNCFPGSAKLAVANGCDKLWRHEYAGQLAFARTSDGALLEATPNHPVLTLRGWVALGDLQEGDHVIQASRDPGGVGEMDVHDTPPSLEECFNFGALLSMGLASAGGFDFHGERPQSDVDVVELTPDLRTRFVAGTLKGGDQLSFARATVDLASAILRTHRACEVSFGHGAASQAGTSGGSESAALVIAQLLQSNKVGFGLRAHAHGASSQDSIDDVAAGVQALGDFENAATHPVRGFDAVLVKIGDAVVCRPSAAAIGLHAPSAKMLAEVVRMHPDALAYVFEGHPLVYEPLRVVEKGGREFSGHVYNLQTVPGWYGINKGIVSHNCRCVAVPVFDPAALEAKYA